MTAQIFIALFGGHSPNPAASAAQASAVHKRLDPAACEAYKGDRAPALRPGLFISALPWRFHTAVRRPQAEI